LLGRYCNEPDRSGAMSSMRDLLLVGAGGFGREAAEAVRAANAHRPAWRLLGFLDDDPRTHGRLVGGVPVLGPAEAVHDHATALVILCTGHPGNYASRRLMAERLELDDERYAALVHPSATVGASSRVGAGSVLLAHVDVTADAAIGRHVAVMPQVVVTHDGRIDDFATLASGVRLGGGCHVETGAYVGSGACVREGLTIGARAMIGMGSVVTRDVAADRLWFGAPATDRAPAPGARAQAAGG
jgi:sugar O-acyltransferase (sialic acid O-acetyltransferase NeuD family)